MDSARSGANSMANSAQNPHPKRTLPVRGDVEPARTHRQSKISEFLTRTSHAKGRVGSVPFLAIRKC
jgi:hypothetical protein